jgi:hypothetical protein
MRDIHKNPMLYYVLIPVLVGLWPLLVWAVYLPKAEQYREVEGSLCVEGQSDVNDILTLDPELPMRMGTTSAPVEFSYGVAVDRVANLCKIPARNCSYTAGNIMVSGGKKRQDARVKLTNVGIVQVAKFLSTMQSYVNLTCENAKVQKKKGTPDQWDVDFSFVYYY